MVQQKPGKSPPPDGRLNTTRAALSPDQLSTLTVVNGQSSDTDDVIGGALSSQRHASNPSTSQIHSLETFHVQDDLSD